MNKRISEKMAPSQEYLLINKLSRSMNNASNKNYIVSVGDDAAIRQGSTSEKLIITTDSMVEDVHFSKKYMSFAEIGYKAMATNISDCAAMGATPDSAFVSLFFPELSHKQLYSACHEIYQGFSKALLKWNFPIAGGNLSKNNRWIIDITLIGRKNKGRLFTRTGIKPGDNLWATGFPGQSAAGLYALSKWGRKKANADFPTLTTCHIAPVPRIDEGLYLAANKKIHAMMDLSDGISKDAATLCFENDLDLHLDLNSLHPPLETAVLSCVSGKPWQEWLLHGGEDYELLFAAAPDFEPAHININKFKTETSAWIKLGTFVHGNGTMFIHQNGKKRVLLGRSWSHL